MTIDIKGILKEMTDLLKSEVNSDSPVIIQSNIDYLVRSEQRLARLAAGAANGSLSFKFVADELNNEVMNLKVHLTAQAQILEADAESLAGKVVKTFLDFLLKTAISVL